ncbi:MAG: hypothetical protein JO235_07740 [Chroococcidiopsidaceae cyanobacterium CP_BM_RX_35]|nr:hypothetical protein [Chroococcidiopsidaceae cyanobacterium CP_BM_RX_35]
MNQQFIDYLIELRNHYRLQQLENEQREHHVTQQLMHINALLVDQLENSNLVESLVELRHQYQQQIAECDRQTAHSREQLSHINALLADQIVQQHEHPTLRASVEQQRSSASALALSLTEAPELADEELTKEGRLEKGLDEQEPPASEKKHNEAVNSFQPAATELFATDLGQEEPETDSSSEVGSASGLEEHSSSDATEDFIAKIKAEEPEESSSAKLPLEASVLPQYQHLTKSEALRQLMEEKAGSALHIDWLLRELYGELAEEQTAAERDRLSETLKDGVEQGLWEKVPGTPECYTINYKLVEPEPAAKTTQKQRDKTKSTSTTQSDLTVLPKYSNASLIDAMELILVEQAGEELTIEQVTKALYGKLTGRKLSQAKEVVGGALSRGAAVGRWHRVVGHKGVYTLEARIVKPASGVEETGSGVEMGQTPLKFLPAYEGMRFMEAAAAVMREHVGEVMTPDQVARILYGDELSGARLAVIDKT